jgi:hypothetical protein
VEEDVQPGFGAVERLLGDAQTFCLVERVAVFVERMVLVTRGLPRQLSRFAFFFAQGACTY